MKLSAWFEAFGGFGYYLAPQTFQKLGDSSALVPARAGPQQQLHAMYGAGLFLFCLFIASTLLLLSLPWFLPVS